MLPGLLPAGGCLAVLLWAAWPLRWPPESWQWIGAAAAASAALGLAKAPSCPALRWTVRAGVVSVAAWLCLKSAAAGWAAGTAGAALLAWAALDRVASRPPGWRAALSISALSAWIGFGALAAGLSGWAHLAFVAGGLSAGTALLAARPAALASAGPALAVLPALLWASAHAYAELHAAVLVLLWAAPLAAAWRPWAGMVPAAAAAGLAFHLSPAFDI